MRLLMKYTVPALLSLLATSTVAAQEALREISLPSAQAGYTQMPTGKTTIYSDDGGTIFVGKGLVTCARFPGCCDPEERAYRRGLHRRRLRQLQQLQPTCAHLW